MWPSRRRRKKPEWPPTPSKRLFKEGEEKVKKLQTQLNTAASNREYQSLKEQIAAAEMANSVMADEVLEGLEKLDAFVGTIAEAEAEVAKVQAEREKVEKTVRRGRTAHPSRRRPASRRT